MDIVTRHNNFISVRMNIWQNKAKLKGCELKPRHLSKLRESFQDQWEDLRFEELGGRNDFNNLFKVKYEVKVASLQPYKLYNKITCES